MAKKDQINEPFTPDELRRMSDLIDKIKQRQDPAIDSKQSAITPPAEIDKKLSIPEKIKRFFNLKRAIIINMETTPGDYDTFYAYPEDNSFIWRNRSYIIDNTCKYYNRRFKSWCLDYHEEFTLPIQRKIDIEKIKKSMLTSGVTDVDHAFNPTSLRLFMTSDVIQKVIKGADIDKVMNFIKMLLIIILIIAAVNCLITIQASGILSNMKMPFAK